MRSGTTLETESKTVSWLLSQHSHGLRPFKCQGHCGVGCCVRNATTSHERPWGKVDVHWTTEVHAVLCFSQSERGPSATRPWHITDRKLVVPGPSETGSWPSHTHHGAEVSANQNAAPVWPTVTPYGQKVGRPRAVRNRKLTFPYTSRCRGLSQSERGPSVTDRDTLRTGVWLSPGRPKLEIDHGDLLSQPIRVRPVTVQNRKLIFLKTSRGWGLAEFCIVFS